MSRQPAYCPAKHAITGLLECTNSVQGHRGVMVLDVSCTLPNPPIQISAIAKPAAMLPCMLLPASINVSPRSPCVTEILRSALAATSVLISAAARAFKLTAEASVMTRLRQEACAPSHCVLRRAVSLLASSRRARRPSKAVARRRLDCRRRVGPRSIRASQRLALPGCPAGHKQWHPPLQRDSLASTRGVCRGKRQHEERTATSLPARTNQKLRQAAD